MLIAVDFDGCIVDMSGRAYDDVTTPLKFMPGAKRALLSLRRAGHILILFSARANRSLRIDPQMDPMVRAGIRRVHRQAWEEDRALNEARYQQMIRFVEAELAGVFAVIDDGMQGKPCADLFVDDRALRYGHGVTGLNWNDISHIYGEPVYGSIGGELQ